MKRALKFAGKTHVGRVLNDNKDSFLIDEDLGLIIVADGMDERNAGELASELAAMTVWDMARNGEPSKDTHPGLSLRGSRLKALVNAANELIFATGKMEPAKQGMGTTLLAVLADTSSMTIAHVGDSRLYLYSAGRLIRLTEDHPTNRVVGHEQAVEVDILDHALSPGDIIIAATDGLTRMAEEEAIAAALRASDDLEILIDALIGLALAGGGQENVTVVVARVPPVMVTSPEMSASSAEKPA